MDVRLSPEQRALREAAAQLADRLGPSSVADLDDAERSAKLEAALAASGWRELRSANDDGQPWATTVEVTLVVEQLSRGGADAAFIGPTLAAELRRLAGADPATSDETVAMTADLGSLARYDGAGAPAVAIDTAGAATALVLGVAGVLASIDLTPVRGASVDLTRPTVALPSTAGATAVAGGVVTGDVLDRWTAFGLALTCADLVGAMHGSIDLACTYAGIRRQYGALIGSFQAVQHLLADAFVSLEGSRSSALHAAWAVDALPASEALAAAAAAKAYCARAARAVCEASIQVHGGIGNTWECLAHVFLRRALLASDLLGGVGPSLDRVLTHHGLGGGDGLR
jgi:alkylation response protein AidB-like acyl-CoA dehydrogenase